MRRNLRARPGGIGVTEAGLTYGLVAAGLDTETAFAAAVAYRFATFYLPPLWGYPCTAVWSRSGTSDPLHLGARHADTA